MSPAARTLAERTGQVFLKAKPSPFADSGDPRSVMNRPVYDPRIHSNGMQPVTRAPVVKTNDLNQS